MLQRNKVPVEYTGTLKLIQMTLMVYDHKM